MKKIIAFILAGILMATALSAKEKRWNVNNLKSEAKIEKLVVDYGMDIVENLASDGGIVKLYKSADGKNWIYLWSRGSKEEFEATYSYALACLDGIYDSFLRYGECTIPNNPYIYATITEKSTSITNDEVHAEDYEYTWTNPREVFFSIFKSRLLCFNELKELAASKGLVIPEDVKERYDYFDKWIAENGDYENSASMLMKEYSKYLKAHK